MATYIWVNIGSGAGLLPDGTKPLHEPMLTNHQWGLRAFLWGWFHGKCWTYVSLIGVWKLLIKRLQLHLPGANELNTFFLLHQFTSHVLSFLLELDGKIHSDFRMDHFFHGYWLRHPVKIMSAHTLIMNMWGKQVYKHVHMNVSIRTFLARLVIWYSYQMMQYTI